MDMLELLSPTTVGFWPEILGQRPPSRFPTRCQRSRRHRDGITISPALSKIYRNQREHDPADLAAAREIASVEDPIPVGILYRDESVPRYEELRHAGALRTPARLRRGLEAELDKFTIWPDAAPVGA